MPSSVWEGICLQKTERHFNNREPWNVFTNPESFYHIIPKIKKLKCSIGIAINRDNIRLLFKHVNYVEF